MVEENYTDIENEKITQVLLSHMEVSLMLRSYDDIFSDFDPRHLSQRALSDDFLVEAKKAAIDKDDTLELRLLIPKKIRNFEKEIVIKKRLREHFKRHFDLLQKDIKKIKSKGIFMALIGVFMIFIATYLHSLESNLFLINFLMILLEPAGWFTAWTGLDEIYYTTDKKRPDFIFYKKMMKSEIHFIPY